MKCVTKSKPVSIRLNQAHFDIAKRELQTESVQVVVDYLLRDFFNKIKKRGLEQMLDMLISERAPESEIDSIRAQIEELSK